MRRFLPYARLLAEATDTNSAEFKAWFAGSKVVDKQGNPIPCYHGTVQEFSQFRTEPHEFTKLYVSDVGAGMLGAFFTESKDVAGSYPLATREGESRRLMTAYLRVENPVRFKNLPALREAMLEFYGGAGKYYATAYKPSPLETARQLAKDYKKHLLSQGHDGAVFKEGPAWNPRKRGMQANVWLVFSNQQIRLVSNVPTAE